MNRWLASRFRSTFVVWLGTGVCVSVAALAVLGYQSVRQWQYSAELLAERRTQEAADLFLTAVTRDMRGVQNSMLTSVDWYETPLDASYDAPVRQLTAATFARYPYPETFFVWRDEPQPHTVNFFVRSDRRPQWIAVDGDSAPFPVLRGRQPAVAAELIEQIAVDAARGRRFSTFDLTLEGTTYQVVACLLYQDRYREQPNVVFGYMVNLDWVHRNYFQDLTQQIGRIVGDDLVLSVVNERDQTVASTGIEVAGAPAAQNAFPFVFFDPLLARVERTARPMQASWAVRATVANGGSDPVLLGRYVPQLILSFAALAAVVLAAGLVLIARAARANANVAEMRSDFVSAVTHELKTPIAGIRALGESLAGGRISDPETSRDYARLVVDEAKRMTRLVDNLLAYARMTDVTGAYAFEPLALESIVDDSLQGFSSQLAAASFEVDVDLPHDLPMVRADRRTIGIAVDNLFDNAIRYSKKTRRLMISARADGANVILEVADEGIGIPESELPHVTRKFVRGRAAASGGSGLGLSIVERVVTDHGGSLSIASTVDVGTTVTLMLPVAGVEA